MNSRYQSSQSRSGQAQLLVEALQRGNLCNACVMELLAIKSRTVLSEVIERANLELANSQILTFPDARPCPKCNVERRTLYTIAPKNQPRTAGTAPPGISSLRQDLQAFLSNLERHPDLSESGLEVTVFSPLFVGTDWDLWGKLHGAIHDHRVVRMSYNDKPYVVAPMHLWWAQGSWYLMAYRMEQTADGRSWRKAANGMRSGLKMARIKQPTLEPDISYPTDLPDPRQWLGCGDWLFRGDAADNKTAVVVLGKHLLHYFRERLESGIDAEYRLWDFQDPIPDWVRGLLTPTVCRQLSTNAAEALASYQGASNPEGDPQTREMLEDDTPAALVAFPYPYGAKGAEGRRVGEFEAARRVLSWGGEAVVLSPASLSNRVRELARIACERQTGAQDGGS